METNLSFEVLNNPSDTEAEEVPTIPKSMEEVNEVLAIPRSLEWFSMEPLTTKQVGEERTQADNSLYLSGVEEVVETDLQEDGGVREGPATLGARLQKLLEMKRLAGPPNGSWRLQRVVATRHGKGLVSVLVLATILALLILSMVKGDSVRDKLEASNLCLKREGHGIICSEEVLEHLVADNWALPTISNAATLLASSVLLFLTWRIYYSNRQNTDSRRLVVGLALLLGAILLPATVLQRELSRQAGEERLEGGQALMRDEFTTWLTDQVEVVAEDMKDAKFRSLREFHRCKALVDVDQEAFQEIIENMALVMEISDNRRDEMKLARHSQATVTMIEDMELGSNGFYTYGKFQTLRRPSGNMDIVFAIHAFKWTLAEEEEGENDVEEEVTKDVAKLGRASAMVSMRERDVWKTQFRREAMRLFETDCPRILMTEMGLKDLKKREEARIEEEKVKAEVAKMYEDVKPQEDEDKENKNKEDKSVPLVGWWLIKEAVKEMFKGALKFKVFGR